MLKEGDDTFKMIKSILPSDTTKNLETKFRNNRVLFYHLVAILSFKYGLNVECRYDNLFYKFGNFKISVIVIYTSIVVMKLIE